MSALHQAQFLNRFPFFTTRQFALLCGRRVDSASRSLTALAAERAIVKVTRGVWAQPSHPHFRPLGAVPYLLQGEQGYVSFLTAMHLHGLLSQIPGSFQVATTGHGRRLMSPIGQFELIRIQASMMITEVELQGTDAPYPLASAEKALLDTLYVSTRRARRFSWLPELDLEGLDFRKFETLLEQQVSAPSIRNAIASRFQRLLPPQQGAGSCLSRTDQR